MTHEFDEMIARSLHADAQRLVGEGRGFADVRRRVRHRRQRHMAFALVPAVVGVGWAATRPVGTNPVGPADGVDDTVTDVVLTEPTTTSIEWLEPTVTTVEWFGPASTTTSAPDGALVPEQSTSTSVEATLPSTATVPGSSTVCTLPGGTCSTTTTP